MNKLNPSRNLAVRPRAGYYSVLFLLAGWLALPSPLRADNAYLTGQGQSVTVSGGPATVTFGCIPGYTYVVQRTTNLMPTVVWVNISTNVAPANGLFKVIDGFSDLGISPTKPSTG